MLSLIKILTILAFGALVSRVYWFDIYKIPSESMEQTLMIGDKIIIRKGTLPTNNEVVVFDMKKWNKAFVKRCVGLPGDTLSIRSDSVFVNGFYLEEKESMQWAYRLDACALNTSTINDIIKRKAAVWQGNESRLIAITKREHQNILLQYPEVVLPQAIDNNKNKNATFPWKWFLKNNRSHIKPFYVPRKGDLIELNKHNLAWYAKIIKLENKGVVIKKDVVSIDGEVVNNYQFKHSYYYMMGDNRNRSTDSRNWGFVREEYIKGRVLFKFRLKPLNMTIIK